MKGKCILEFEQLLRYRQSTRRYKAEASTKEQIAYILNAANRAPVGSNLYQEVHITVVENKEILLKFCEAAWERFSIRQKLKEIAGDTLDQTMKQPVRNNLFYDAPIVFFIYSKSDASCCN